MTRLFTKYERKALRRASKEIKSYRTDLGHDARILRSQDKPPSFLHFAGECGTHIVPLESPSSEIFPPAGERVPFLFGYADRHHILESAIHLVRAMKNGVTHRLVQYVDKGKCQEITKDEALLIVTKHVNWVEDCWRRQARRAA